MSSNAIKLLNGQQAFEKLYSFSTEDDPLRHDNDQYDEGDENAPFFTEAFLYNLLGKEDARTLLALTRHVGRALGFDDDGFDIMTEKAIGRREP